MVTSVGCVARVEIAMSLGQSLADGGLGPRSVARSFQSFQLMIQNVYIFECCRLRHSTHVLPIRMRSKNARIPEFRRLNIVCVFKHLVGAWLNIVDACVVLMCRAALGTRRHYRLQLASCPRPRRRSSTSLSIRCMVA